MKNTEGEYFELEKHASIRHEFHYGKLIAIPRESKNANEMAQNCAFAFRIALRQRGYRIFIQDRDRVTKLKEYSKVPSMDYYLIVDQNSVNVQVYSRHKNGGWHYQVFEDLAHIVNLQGFEMDLSLETIYENIKIGGEQKLDNESLDILVEE